MSLTRHDGADGAVRMRTEHRRSLLTVGEAATYLSVTTRHIRRLVYEHRLTHTKVGRLLRFDPNDLDEYLAARRVRGIP